MKVIDKRLLDETSEKAKASPRFRINYNFHEQLDDPINRLLNAMEPETYIRPHRHLNPPKEEIFFILRGKVMLFVFDDKGNITDKLLMGPEEGVYGAELPAGTWHSLLVLETNTVLYEVKPGPFVPLSEEDMAAWSPEQDETEKIGEYMKYLRSL